LSLEVVLWLKLGMYWHIYSVQSPFKSIMVSLMYARMYRILV
jgi:hypothetical protein